MPYDYRLNTPFILQLVLFTNTIPTSSQNNRTVINVCERSITNAVSTILSLTSCYNNKFFAIDNAFTQFRGVSTTNTPIGFYLRRSSDMFIYSDYIYLVEANIIYQTDSYCSSSYTDKA